MSAPGWDQGVLIRKDDPDNVAAGSNLSPSSLASCIAICDIKTFRYTWVSTSITVILGYTPAEMLAMSPFDLVHPDEREPMLEARYQFMAYDKVAVLTYSRWKHKNGHYVLCVAGSSVVYDKLLGSLSLAVSEPKAKLRAATAQEVLEISPEAQKQFSKQKWFKSSPPFRRTSDSFLTRADRERLRVPIEQLALPSKRSFLLLDRFSQSETIFYVSNDVLLKRPNALKGLSFYDIVAEEDREKLRMEIQMAKSWAGAARDGIEQSSFIYVTFTIQEPSEVSIEVQGILAAYSDGISCIIRPT